MPDMEGIINAIARSVTRDMWISKNAVYRDAFEKAISEVRYSYDTEEITLIRGSGNGDNVLTATEMLDIIDSNRARLTTDSRIEPRQLEQFEAHLKKLAADKSSTQEIIEVERYKWTYPNIGEGIDQKISYPASVKIVAEEAMPEPKKRP